MSVHLHPRSILAAGGALALAGCLSLPAVAQGGNLQSAVNSALANDAALHGQHVTAKVQNGEVTLSGTVQSDKQRQEAETAVANVPGVVGIADNIQVPGEAQTTQTPPPPANEPPAAQTAPQAPPPPPPDQSTPPSQPAGRVPYQGYGARPAPQPPSGPVTVPAGSLLQIRTSEPLNVTKLQAGASFQVTVASDVYEGNVLAIPRGAVLQGTVANVKQPGRFGGSGVLDLRLTQLQLGGNSYPLETDVWSSKSPNKAGYTAANTAGGAIMGAIIGGIIGRGPGAAIGALAGGGAGLLASGATNGPRVMLPPETLLNFHLAKPITVQPVSWEEAQRLASSVPRLQRRVVYRPYPYYPPPPPYPYYYPY